MTKRVRLLRRPGSADQRLWVGAARI